MELGLKQLEPPIEHTAISYIFIYIYTRWWQLKYFLFSPLVGEDSHFTNIFLDGLKPPTSIYIYM